MDPDEAHYAQLTREMLRAGNWMIPLLDGLPYIDKPVLFHWLQGLAIAVLGETETAMRLPSAIAAVALFWMTRWTGAQLFDERIGVRAWLMLATLPLTFMLGQHRRVRHGVHACFSSARLRSRSSPRCEIARGSNTCRTCF